MAITCLCEPLSDSPYIAANFCLGVDHTNLYSTSRIINLFVLLSAVKDQTVSRYHFSRFI